MTRMTSSAAWLVSKFSRAKGSVDRTISQIEDLERRAAFHRQMVQSCEARLEALREKLVHEERVADSLGKTLELHEAALKAADVTTIRPHEQPRAFEHGGMGRAIFRELRTAPTGFLSIDELERRLVAVVRLPPEQHPLLRQRLQIRLSIMAKQGKVRSLDPPLSPGRRWELAEEWAPVPPPKCPRLRATNLSSGEVSAARWLIQAQQNVAMVQHLSAGRCEPLLAARQAMIGDVWSLHPMHFPVQVESSSPLGQSHASEVRARVSQRLVEVGTWVTLNELGESDPLRTRRGRKIGLGSIQKALRQFLLEGRVEHRRLEEVGHVEWRWRSSVGESISTSGR